MPISSSERKNIFKSKKVKTVEKVDDTNSSEQSSKVLLSIEPALPLNERRKLYKRSHSLINLQNTKKAQESFFPCDSVNLETNPDGSVFITRTAKQKEGNFDRLSLDRKGLSTVPMIRGETNLRLLSLQHNLINNLDCLGTQKFHFLVFLDLYDNQLERINGLDEAVENIRVILIGKNRLKRIEGFQNLKQLEVLDLHGNKISHINGLTTLDKLKVLNLAGNQIRNVGVLDLQGLNSLQELNLRRNRLKKLLGFGETTQLTKLFLSNNNLQSVEDMSSLAKSTSIKELCIENNPVALGGDCLSFLVSYLPELTKLNSTHINEQVRKAAMAWRRNKENTNRAFMDLTSDVCLNIRREQVISNARTNWELLRSQTKCINSKYSGVSRTLKNLQPDSDFVLTSFTKSEPKSKSKNLLKNKAPILPNKKLHFVRTSSQDTETSQNTSSSNTSSNNEYFRLPPILVPIINKLEQDTLSGLGPNADSPLCSLGSDSDCSYNSRSNGDYTDEDVEGTLELTDENVPEAQTKQILEELPCTFQEEIKSDSSSNISCTTSISNITLPSTSELETVGKMSRQVRNIRSASNLRSASTSKIQRAATAKPKKQQSPQPNKDREQGGDYLIEISGSTLNVYGQGAVRFIDKSWNPTKANCITTVKFNYINFNSIMGIFNKLKQRFPNIENLEFKETNIYCLGQLNALAEVQGLTSLVIHPDGNLINNKKWQSYAIFRLSHWGLKNINGIEIGAEDIASANEEYESLNDLVLWTLPDVLLQPLLIRLRIDTSRGLFEKSTKKWLMSADPALRSVVSKEALQWKKRGDTQEDTALRQKAKQHISLLLQVVSNAVGKLRVLDQQWPAIMHEFVCNTLLDYSHLDMYMKQKLQEIIE